MAILNVSGVPFNYPDPGTEAGWGEDATGWAEAVTTLLSSLYSEGDILPTSFAIQNNITVLTDVAGLSFVNDVIRAANVSYSIFRQSDTTPNGVVESGTILLNLNDNAPVGEKWSMTQTKNGEAGVILSVTDSGQLQYKSSNIGAVNHTGTIKFSAKALTK